MPLVLDAQRRTRRLRVQSNERLSGAALGKVNPVLTIQAQGNGATETGSVFAVGASQNTIALRHMVEMQFPTRTIVIRTGDTFDVPRYISRIDKVSAGGSRTHGSQVRYQPGNRPARFFRDGSYGPRASLNAAIAYLESITRSSKLPRIRL